MSAKIPSLPPIHSIGANFENVDARFINPKEIKLFPDSILTFQPNVVVLCVPVTFLLLFHSQTHWPGSNRKETE